MNANGKLALGIAVGIFAALSIAGLATRSVDDSAPTLAESVAPAAYGNCRISFTILNDKESWFGKTELYLKVESTLHPDLKALVPLNVGGEFSGRTNGVVELPFIHSGSTDETYYLNLLEEDGLEEEETERIASLAAETGAVVWHGSRVYALGHGVYIPMSAEPVSWLAENATTAVVENLNQHWYDSFGEAEYRVPKNPPKSDRDANTLTIVDGDEPKVEVRFHYPRCDLPN